MRKCQMVILLFIFLHQSIHSSLVNESEKRHRIGVGRRHQSVAVVVVILRADGEL